MPLDPAPADPPAAAKTDPLPDGAALVAARCSVCRPAQRALSQASRDRAWRTGILDRMIRHGARLDPAEKQVVLDYVVGRPAS